MAKPRVFVSSTFYDLKYIRSSIEQFIINLGFEPILSEKGSIAYNPDLPLDESCYNEAQICDLFVMIIGGRYGAEITATRDDSLKQFYDRYISITRKEYESAKDKNIPIYIFIERNVYTEYELFRNNKNKQDINYVQVDSVNTFYMIEQILGQLCNNPVHPFDKISEIEDWLKDQWAGLFRDLLLKRNDRSNLLTLAAEIEELKEIKKSLMLIVEPIMQELPACIRKINNKQQEQLNEERKMRSLQENIFVQELIKYYGVEYNEIVKAFEKATCLEEIARFVNKYSPNKTEKKLLVEWRIDQNQLHNVNSVRDILELPRLNFAEKKYVNR